MKMELAIERPPRANGIREVEGMRAGGEEVAGNV